MEMKWESSKGLSFTIKDKEINGVIGTHKEEVVSQINLKRKDKSKIYINQEALSAKDRNKYN